MVVWRISIPPQRTRERPNIREKRQLGSAVIGQVVCSCNTEQNMSENQVTSGCAFGGQ